MPVKTRTKRKVAGSPPGSVAQNIDRLVAVRRLAYAAWLERSPQLPSNEVQVRAEALLRELCRDQMPQSLASLADAWAAETEELGLTPFVMLGLPLELADRLRASGADDLASQAREFLLLTSQVRHDRAEDRWSTTLEQEVTRTREAYLAVIGDYLDDCWRRDPDRESRKVAVTDVIQGVLVATGPLLARKGQHLAVETQKRLGSLVVDPIGFRRILIEVVAHLSSKGQDGQTIAMKIFRQPSTQLVIAFDTPPPRGKPGSFLSPVAHSALSELGGTVTRKNPADGRAALVILVPRLSR